MFLADQLRPEDARIYPTGVMFRIADTWYWLGNGNRLWVWHAPGQWESRQSNMMIRSTEAEWRDPTLRGGPYIYEIELITGSRWGFEADPDGTTGVYRLHDVPSPTGFGRTWRWVRVRA